jgi:hypothetical protein
VAVRWGTHPDGQSPDQGPPKTVAIELTYLCPPAEGACSVGAGIVDDRGHEASGGYS